MTKFMFFYSFFSVCIAFIVKGLAGFGDPLISTPLLSFRLPNSLITPGLVPVSLVLNARVVWVNRKSFSWNIVLPISFFVLLGIVPGTYLLRYGASDVLKLVLGLTIILLGLEMLTRKAAVKHMPNAFVRSVVSFISGITAGLFGIDLLFLAYLERVSGNRVEFRTNVCFVFFLECIFRIIMYSTNSMFTKESLLLTIAALPGAFLGMKIGSLVDKRVNDKLSHRLIIYIFIAGGVSTTIYALINLL